ncbi:hypothetical protein [Halobacillus faecis]|uniref:IrrE N-terminal-like domain-containing protein n=1 Tax=Halobacillus faecis TaxID=360184 RepID=A0A511WW89_9BACI|nr:hypothetical protein [Halobacillus faecis]GEN54591.1 hypothetical protein HFA01_28530 [Halobacillus faecis]
MDEILKSLVGNDIYEKSNLRINIYNRTHNEEYERRVKKLSSYSFMQTLFSDLYSILKYDIKNLPLKEEHLRFLHKYYRDSISEKIMEQHKTKEDAIRTLIYKVRLLNIIKSNQQNDVGVTLLMNPHISINSTLYILKKVTQVKGVILVPPLIMESISPKQYKNRVRGIKKSNKKENQEINIIKDLYKKLGMHISLTRDQAESIKKKFMLPVSEGEWILLCPLNIEEFAGAAYKLINNDRKPEGSIASKMNKEIFSDGFIMDSIYNFVLLHEFGHSVFKSYDNERGEYHFSVSHNILKKLGLNVDSVIIDDENKADIFALTLMENKQKITIRMMNDLIVSASSIDAFIASFLSNNYNLLNDLIDNEIDK